MTDEEIIDFINDPNSIGFIVRDSEYVRKLFSERPEIVTNIILENRYLIAYTTRQYYDQLIIDIGTGAINTISLVLGLLDRVNLESAGILQVQEQPFLDLRGRGVLIGFVDTGIDYTKSAFIYEDGTSKIQYLYDMTIKGNPPEGFYLGTEYTNSQINEALKSSNPFDVVPSRDTVGHGTFLASIAAGRAEGDLIGAAPDADLIIVKLRTARPFYRETFAIPPNQENAYESITLMAGVEYIIRKAQELKRPVAICIAVGSNLGGHDGFTLFEEYLSIVAKNTGVCLCAAAGNESQARHHTQATIPKSGDFVSVEIKVGENAGNILITIYNGASDRISVAIRSPSGELIGRIPAKDGTVVVTRLVLEKSSVRVAYFFPIELNGEQGTAITITNATPGIWTILVYGDIVLDGTFHCWLPITGFVSPTVEFLTPVPFYTVVVPSTVIGIICCGAYDSATNSLYPNSSWGPTRLPIMAPDLVAPGVNVTGVYPTGTGTMDGTSVSAAITTGACALLLQWGIVEGYDPSMSTFQARAYLIRGCTRDPNLTYPNTQWGYGRLNLIQTFNLMRDQ